MCPRHELCTFQLQDKWWLVHSDCGGKISRIRSRQMWLTTKIKPVTKMPQCSGSILHVVLCITHGDNTAKNCKILIFLKFGWQSKYALIPDDATTILKRVSICMCVGLWVHNKIKCLKCIGDLFTSTTVYLLEESSISQSLNRHIPQSLAVLLGKLLREGSRPSSCPR